MSTLSRLQTLVDDRELIALAADAPLSILTARGRWVSDYSDGIRSFEIPGTDPRWSWGAFHLESGDRCVGWSSEAGAAAALRELRRTYGRA